MKMKKPELMCPIRDWASLEACKEFADAVYFGTAELSMRANTGSIKISDLPKFVEKCHTYGIKAYLTVNSVLYNENLKKAEQLIKKAKASQADAVILWDPAAIEIAGKEKIPFIISTQANVSNWQSAEFYRKSGAKRVVLARELNLNQIKEIKKKTKIEIETFVHGAMCMAISGRCHLSAFMYDKSANCGDCGQPCRKQWTLIDDEENKIISEGKFFLSAKDLCMIEFIPELIKAGIDSFKIEGRRRDPRYVQTTARCYREAIDAHFAGTFTEEKVRAWKKDLNEVYNRGFSTGFYFGEPKKQGIGFDKADNLSPTKKIFAGIVTKYYPKISVASVKLTAKPLKINDEISIEGTKNFCRQTVESMEIENKSVQRARRGDEIAIKVKSKVRAKDNLFIIKP
ncbi:U32 family peptidase [Patescibacteria group bacterium]|nr:U32 family peptidase [Patescibacteria group bacterium]